MHGRRSLRRSAAAGVVGVGVLVAGCGTTDEASRQTLPPIRTTTSTTTTSTTVPSDRFYTIQRGDTLAVIAARFQVTVQSIVDLNGLANPDAIQAGQTIEIPSSVRTEPEPAPSEPPSGAVPEGGDASG